MTNPEIARALRNLDGLSIENLACGRITKHAMHEAASRLSKFRLLIGGSPGCVSNTDEMHLSDELNDMLQAARERKDRQ